MKHDWKAEKSPTAQAINNVVAQEEKKRIQANINTIQRLRDIRSLILAEITSFHSLAYSDELLAAMNHLGNASTEIEIYLQRTAKE